MENIPEIQTKGVKDTPTTPVEWTVTDSKGSQWIIRPVTSKPGMFSIITASSDSTYPEDATTKTIKEEEPLVEGHKANCTCSKCFLAKKNKGTVVVQAPKPKLNKCLLNRRIGTATDTWWINDANPILIKHISTRPMHAYGMSPYDDQTICIWDELYQINFWWRISPVPNHAGYYFFYQYEGNFTYAAQQMGGTNKIPDRVSMWYIDAVVALLPWTWLKVNDADPTFYGYNYLWFKWGHNNFNLMMDNSAGYNFWPVNGTQFWQAPLQNTIDPCWYFYFEELAS